MWHEIKYISSKLLVNNGIKLKMNEKLQLFATINVIIVAVFVILVFSQANKKYVLDEIDFPAVAKTISENGTPYEYRGETAQRALGLWHPPLYAYSLGMFVKVFGSNENTVRAFGMCCTLLSAFLCLLIYSELFQTIEQLAHRVSTIFLSLFLLHPYTIANTTLPDIDSTVLAVTFLLFIYGLARILGTINGSAQPNWSVANTIFMSALFSLNLWAKLTTPLVLIPTLLSILFIKGLSLGRSTVIAICVSFVGGVIFLLTYGLFCYLLNLPYDFTFRFLLLSFTKNSSSGEGILALLTGVFFNLSFIKQFVIWLGLPFMFALTLAFTSMIFKKFKSESEIILILLTIVGLFVTTFYLGLVRPFGGFYKYPYPTFPILILIIAHYINDHLIKKQFQTEFLKISWQNRTFFLGHGQSIYILFVLVMITVCYYQLAVWKDIAFLKGLPISFLNIFSLIGIAVFIGALAAKKSENILYTYGIVILFAVMVGTQFGISRSQAVAIYPTKYHYGQLGFDETVSYLKERLAPNEPIWSMKDIGHYSSVRYFENYGTIFKTAAEITLNLEDVIKNKGVRYFVVTQGIGQDRIDAYTELKYSLDSCCFIDHEIGNFIIYKVKQDE